MSQQIRSQDWILVADIGGTNARFSVVARGDGSLSSEIFTIATKNASDFIPAVEEVIPKLGDATRLKGMVLAIAGPVDGDVVCLTNAGWTFDRTEIKRRFSLEEVIIINDFTAISYAVTQLLDDDYHVLQMGNAAPIGNIAIIGPGTGLGVASLYCASDGTYYPIAGEGGHTTYAPETEEEWFVYNKLSEKYGRVSYERIVSGAGLLDVAKALGAGGRIQSPQDVTQAAIQDRCPTCLKSFNLFFSALGRFCGDIALTINASSGVYVAGGILPQIYHDMDVSPILTAFLNKGRYRDRMKRIPLRLITRPDPAFLGLKTVAQDLFFEFR